MLSYTLSSICPFIKIKKSKKNNSCPTWKILLPICAAGLLSRPDLVGVNSNSEARAGGEDDLHQHWSFGISKQAQNEPLPKMLPECGRTRESRGLLCNNKWRDWFLPSPPSSTLFVRSFLVDASLLAPLHHAMFFETLTRARAVSIRVLSRVG